MGSSETISFPRPLTADGNPDPLLVKLIREQPVLRVTGPGGGDAWLVGGDQEVREVLSDPLRFTSFTNPGVDQRAATTSLMVGMDPPEHTRLRKLAMQAFGPRRIQAMIPEIEKIVGSLLDRMEACGPPVDLVKSLSLPLPLAVIGQILGLPDEDQDDVHRWSMVFISLTEYTTEEVVSALENMQAYIRNLIARRRGQLGDDLVSDLIRARDGRDALTEDELAGTILLLMLAGHETTAKAITRSGIALSGSGILERVAAGAVPVKQVVEEVLRHQPPIDTGLFRWARVDTELAGRQITAGEQIFVSLQLANLDPVSRANPEVLDPDRDATRHVTFGYGIHLCLGAALARAELTVVIRELALRFPALRLHIPAEELVWTVGAMLNAPTELPVTW